MNRNHTYFEPNETEFCSFNIIAEITYKPTDEYYKVISEWEKEHPDW